MALNTGGAGGQEILEFLHPRWEAEEGRSCTYVTFECPLCGARGPRVKVPLAAPLDGGPPPQVSDESLLRRIVVGNGGSPVPPGAPWWGKLGFDRHVLCPAGHKIIVEGGMVRQRRHNEGD